MDHEGDGLAGIEGGVARAGKTGNNSASFFLTTVANEPPRGFGRKEGADQDRDGPNPLESVRNAVGLVARRHASVRSSDLVQTGGKRAHSPIRRYG